MTDIQEITEKIKQFRDERDWKQFHSHKNMAISLALEAAEVLEHFQWKNDEQIQNYVTESKDEISEELADVAMYLFELCDNLGVDLKEAMERKIEINKKSTP